MAAIKATTPFITDPRYGARAHDWVVRSGDHSIAANYGDAAWGGAVLQIVPGGSGTTPATAEIGPYRVVFDGVLYNRLDLARLVSDFGPPEEDDTGLVLQAYALLGEGVLEEIRGIYTLIIRDSRQDLLLCARDPLGFHPLFYVKHGRMMLFSPSIEALLRCPEVSGELNREALAEVLCRRCPGAETTFFSEIQRIPLGHALVIDGNGCRTFQYWDPSPPGTPVDSMKESDLCGFEYLLEQAVERCLSLGRPGIYLSSGLDSVTVAAFAADCQQRKNAEPPLALSIAFPHPDCNEEAAQRAVAESLGLPQLMTPFDETVEPYGLIESALQVSSTLPAPLQNPWRPAYQQIGLRGKALGCRIILTGGGGDDWLTVNSDYMADLMRSFDVLGCCRFLRSNLRSYRLPKLAMLRFLLWNSGLRPLLASYARQALGVTAPGWLQRYRRRKGLALQPIPDWIAADSGLRRALRRGAERRMEMTLGKAEPNGPYGFYRQSAISSTYAQLWVSADQEEDFEVGRRLGLHLLHPYWDPDLIRFLCSIPPRLLMRNGRDKDIVRRILDGRFPQLSFGRQKKIIASRFFESRLRSEGPGLWRKTGGASALAELGVVDGTTIDAFVARCISSRSMLEVNHLWEILNLEVWVRSRVESQGG